MFTEEEERILKLMAAEIKARIKLNIENRLIGEEIRTELRAIDDRIREEHRLIFTPLEENLKTAQKNLEKAFE